MTTFKRSLAAIEFVLIFPAALFMTALFVRNIQPSPYQPAETGRRIVDWFSARPHLGLAILLIALPFVAFVTGFAALIAWWRKDSEIRRATLDFLGTIRNQLAVIFVAIATLAAGGILGIVALHMITD